MGNTDSTAVSPYVTTSQNCVCEKGTALSVTLKITAYAQATISENGTGTYRTLVVAHFTLPYDTQKSYHMTNYLAERYQIHTNIRNNINVNMNKINSMILKKVALLYSHISVSYVNIGNLRRNQNTVTSRQTKSTDKRSKTYAANSNMNERDSTRSQLRRHNVAQQQMHGAIHKK